MKRIFIIFLILFVASSVWAYDFEVDGIYYNIITENEVEVTSSEWAARDYYGNIIIPTSIVYNGIMYNVTSIGYEAMYGCSEMTSIVIPNSVKTIDYGAFWSCKGLTSLTIPNSVTKIGGLAFLGCTGLTTMIIPNSVIELGGGAFKECNFTSITLPDNLDVSLSGLGFEKNNIHYDVKNNKEVRVTQNVNKKIQGEIVIPEVVTAYGITFQVTEIESYAFYECTELTSIVIPNSVTSINNNVFSGCTNLTTYVGPVPSYFNPNPLFENVKITGGCLDEYFTFSQNLKTIDFLSELDCKELVSDYHFYMSHNIESIIIPEKMDVSRAELYFVKNGIRYKVLNGKDVAVVKNGYYDDYEFHTTYYSGDVIIPSTVTAGNTFNVISIEDNAFENCSNVTSISIPNSITSVKYAFQGCTGLSSIIIPDELDFSRSGLQFKNNNICYKVLNNKSVAVTSSSSEVEYSGEIIIPNTVTGLGYTFSVTTIGYAFDESSNLTSITIPASVTEIYDEAFYGCTNLRKVTCLATNPPKAYKDSFENYNGTLYIPCESKDLYKESACWGTFKNIECIGAETVELTNDEVAVVPEKTEAEFSMPKNENANSYTLTISNNGVTFCALTFNAQGQLANIDFSTTKSYELKSDVEGFKFTVTGLSTASDYGYSFKALASNKSVLKEYAGSFTTKNEDGTGGSVQGGGEGTLAVEAVSNSTAVTVVNAQILVNGEAPAFVVTVSGQKIANANLKAGVYFAVVDGEMVGVSVR
jgi:hypothetical protein